MNVKDITCEYEFPDVICVTLLDGGGEVVDERDYVPERTCKRVTKTNERPGKTVFNQWYACSECGNPMGHGENFCASCGAKVVGD